MRRHIAELVLLVAGCLFGTHAAFAQDDCFFADQTRTVLSRDDVQRSGAIRLSGLLRLMPDWHTTSTDFYLWDAAPGIFALPDWNGMSVMVDGQPLTASLLGDSYLNAYPLDVGLIDSVVVFEGPVLCSGMLAPSGLISIYTRLETGYVSVGASGAMANESGDPGPYLYTPYASPNVDRSGPAGSAFGAFSGDHWHLRASATIDEHHVTDDRLRPRVRRLHSDLTPPRDYLNGRRADVGVRFPRASVSLSVDESRFEHFRFMPTVGSEVPFTLEWARGGARARGEVTSTVSFFLSGEYAILDRFQYPYATTLPPAWRDRSGQIHGGVILSSPRGRYGTGFSAYETRASGDADLFDSTLSGQAWFFMLEAMPRDDVTVSAMMHFAREDARSFRSALARASWSPIAGHTLRVGLSAVELPSHRTANLFFWANRGLEAPALPNLVPSGAPSADAAVRLTASVGWHWSPVRFARIALTGTVARFSRFPLPAYRRSFVRHEDEFGPNFQWFETQTNFHPETAGRTARIAFEATIEPLRSVTGRMYYAYTHVTTDDHVFGRAWAIIPAYRRFASVTIIPRDRVSVHARISFESPSHWPQFAAVAAATDGLYPTRLPELALLDVAVTKHFWQHRIKASALVSNILNRHFQRHPAGATESISLLARIQVEL